MTAPARQAPGRGPVSAVTMAPDAMRVADFAKVFGFAEARPPLRQDGGLWTHEPRLDGSGILPGDGMGPPPRMAFRCGHRPDATAAFDGAIYGAVQAMAGDLGCVSTHAQDRTPVQAGAAARALETREARSP